MFNLFTLSVWYKIKGLMPVVKYNDRPKPIFSLIGFGDLQLEGLSWVGLYLCLLFVKFESMVLVVRYAIRVVFVVSDRFKLSFSGFWSILHLTHLPIFIGLGH